MRVRHWAHSDARDSIRETVFSKLDRLVEEQPELAEMALGRLAGMAETSPPQVQSWRLHRGLAPRRSVSAVARCARDDGAAQLTIPQTAWLCGVTQASVYQWTGRMVGYSSTRALLPCQVAPKGQQNTVLIKRDDLLVWLEKWRPDILKRILLCEIYEY